MSARTSGRRRGDPRVPGPRAPTAAEPRRGNHLAAFGAGVAGALFGFITGFIIAAQSPSAGPGAVLTAAPPAAASAAAPALLDDHQVRAYQDVLARDPGNAVAAAALGNLFYDAQRYREAIPYYRQALQIDPTNADVSTDLGTALWYTGQADAAITQYEASLKAVPDHAHTLFNLGIVALEGKRDARRAVETWDRLLSTHPDYPNRARVEELLARARQEAGTS